MSGPGTTEEAAAPGHDAGTFVVLFALLLPLAYSEATYHTFLAPKVALSLVALVPAVVALVRIATRSRDPGDGRTIAARLAVGFCVAAALSTALADEPLLSLTGHPGSATGMLFVLLCAGGWALGTGLSSRSRRLLGTAVVAAGLLNALVAWLQGRGWVPTGLEMESSGPLAARASGLLGNPIYLGGLCAGCLLLVGARVRTSRPAAVPIVLAGVVAGGAQLSGGRSSLGLSLLALGVVLVRWWPGRLRAAALVGVVLIAIPLSTAGADVVDATSRSQGEHSLDGTGTRLTTWRYGVEGLREKPLLGWGPDRFAAATTPRYSAEATADGIHTNAHNWVVEYATTTGLVGVALLLLWLAAAARGAIGPLAWFALFQAIFALVEPTSLALTPLSLLALGAARPGEGPAPPPGNARRWFVPSMTLVGAAIGLAAGVVYLTGQVRLADALVETSTRRWEAAERNLPSWPEVTNVGSRIESYHALAPGATAHRRRALVLARQTAARDEADPRWWAALGFLERKWGSRAAAAAAFERALERMPWSPLAWRGVASMADDVGDDARRDEACRRLDRVVAKLPSPCS